MEEKSAKGIRMLFVEEWGVNKKKMEVGNKIEIEVDWYKLVMGLLWFILSKALHASSLMLWLDGLSNPWEENIKEKKKKKEYDSNKEKRKETYWVLIYMHGAECSNCWMVENSEEKAKKSLFLCLLNAIFFQFLLLYSPALAQWLGLSSFSFGLTRH